jgi:hypothetical protein
MTTLKAKKTKSIVSSEKEILVCGYAPADRLQSILSEFDGTLSLKAAHTRDELARELAAGQQPICILEHEIYNVDVLGELANVLGVNEADEEAFFAGIVKKAEAAANEACTALDLLPQLIASSPDTRFVITSHTRGSGLSPKQHAAYKAFPEVVKVMGFVNSNQNYKYLKKLLERAYGSDS